MAQLTNNIRGTNNAYEFSETIVSSGTGKVQEALFIPSNVATVVLGIRRKTGTAKFKVQITVSTRDEVDAGTAEWFDWTISGVDSNGYLDDDDVVWWVPIPSHLRLVVEAGDATNVYMSVRAN